jgi:predicted nucleic acid-binding protein
VIFVDTNVFMYAVGAAHPLQDEARQFFRQSKVDRIPLVTSVEVLQELLHAYVPVQRLATLASAWQLAESETTIWGLDLDDLQDARALASRHAGLGARDLIHIATCQRRKVDRLHTYDSGLRAAWDAP